MRRNWVGQSRRPGRARRTFSLNPSVQPGLNGRLRFGPRDEVRHARPTFASLSDGCSDDDRNVAIGIASSRPVGTIAFRECNRRAAGAVPRHRVWAQPAVLVPSNYEFTRFGRRLALPEAEPPLLRSHGRLVKGAVGRRELYRSKYADRSVAGSCRLRCAPRPRGVAHAGPVSARPCARLSEPDLSDQDRGVMSRTMSDERRISVPIPLDSDGFLRRECQTCTREFKWRVSGEDEKAEQPDAAGYFCPYCAIQAPVDDWSTPAQLDYVGAIGTREIIGPLFDQFERSGFKVERDLPAGPPELTEDDDMRRVDFACHLGEPVKVLEGWSKAVYCLICGESATVS